MSLGHLCDQMHIVRFTETKSITHSLKQFSVNSYDVVNVGNGDKGNGMSEFKGLIPFICSYEVKICAISTGRNIQDIKL